MLTSRGILDFYMTILILEMLSFVHLVVNNLEILKIRFCQAVLSASVNLVFGFQNANVHTYKNTMLLTLAVLSNVSAKAVSYHYVFILLFTFCICLPSLSLPSYLI